MTSLDVLSIIGVLVSLIAVILTVKEKNSLTGSFFKNYYNWSLFGEILLALGFATEIFDEVGVTAQPTGEVIHHVMLIISAIIFILINFHLPKEAAKYMKACETGQIKK